MKLLVPCHGFSTWSAPQPTCVWTHVRRLPLPNHQSCRCRVEGLWRCHARFLTGPVSKSGASWLRSVACMGQWGSSRGRRCMNWGRNYDNWACLSEVILRSTVPRTYIRKYGSTVRTKCGVLPYGVQYYCTSVCTEVPRLRLPYDTYARYVTYHEQWPSPDRERWGCRAMNL